MVTADPVTSVDINAFFERLLTLLHGDGDKYLTILGISLLVFLTCVAWSSYSLPIILPYTKLRKLAWWPDLFVSGNARGSGQNFIFWFRFLMGLELLGVQLWDLQCQKGDAVWDYFKYFSTWNWTLTWVYLLTASYATWRYWYNSNNNSQVRINNKYYKEYEVAPVPASIQWAWLLNTIVFHSEVWIVTLFYWIEFYTFFELQDKFSQNDNSQKIRNIHRHGIAALILIIDMLVVKQPILFIHILYPIIWWLLWIGIGVVLQLYYPSEKNDEQGIAGPIGRLFTFIGSIFTTGIALIIGIIGYILMALINNKIEGRGWFYNIKEFFDEYGGESSLFYDEEEERLLAEKL